jgi:hypothetical protein
MKALFSDIGEKVVSNYGFHKKGKNTNPMVFQLPAWKSFVKLQEKRGQTEYNHAMALGC